MGPWGMSDLHVVTGALGYSGKYVAARLLEAGHRVRTLTSSTHRANPFEGRVDVHPFNFDDPTGWLPRSKARASSCPKQKVSTPHAVLC